MLMLSITQSQVVVSDGRHDAALVIDRETTHKAGIGVNTP